jgi:putative sugar O-methyltransferase
MIDYLGLLAHLPRLDEELHAVRAEVAVLRHELNRTADMAEAHQRSIWYLHDILPYLERLVGYYAKFLSDRGETGAPGETEHLGQRLDELDRHMAVVEKIYTPDLHWAFYNERIKQLLRIFGPSRFKQTINWYYFQFRITSENDWLLSRIRELQSQLPPAEPAHLKTPWDFSTAFEANLNAEYVAKLHNYALSLDDAGEYRTLEEPMVGAPSVFEVGTIRVSQDVAHSWLEYQHLKKVIKEPLDSFVIAELGAGYGRLASVVGRLTNARIWIFDVPPSLAVSEWYISKCFPECRIFRFRRFNDFSEIASELAQCRFAFFAADQLELLPDNAVDLFITVSSLHEMRRDQVENFMAQMGRTTARWLYIKQWQSSIAHVKGDIISQADYRVPGGFSTVSERLTPHIPSFFEKIMRKQSTHED